MATNLDKNKGVDFSLLIPTLILTIVFCIVIFYFPEASNNFLTKVFVWATGSLGWVFILFTFACVSLTLWFIFGRYANKKLGDEEPERSIFSWISLIFVGSASASIVYWSVLEFFFYVQKPPFRVEPFSLDAYTWASAYGSFHWGPFPHCLYAAPAVVFAFMIFVKKVDTPRVSTACTSVIGAKNANGFLGKIFDITYMTALLISGAGISLGMSTPLVGTLVERVLGIEHTIVVDAILIILWTILFTITVYTGLQKGMRYIAVFRVGVIFALLTFILFAGPTSFMINNALESVGTQLQNLILLTTYTDALGKSRFPQDWTIFYYAFFLSSVVNFGIYYGRISRGRTVRQVALAVCFSGATGAMLFFWIMGNYSIDVCMKDPETFTALMESDPYDAIIYVWSTLPFSDVIIFAFLFYAFISVWSFMQALSYTLAMVSQKGLVGTEEPGKLNRIFWCALMGLLALALLFLGGLQTVKNSAVLSAIPGMILVFIAMIALLKDMNKTWGLPKK